MRAMNTAATGMMAQQTNVEVISNNIANQNTTGFKRQRAEFQDLLYQDRPARRRHLVRHRHHRARGAQVGLGVKTAAVNRITTQGNLLQTSNALISPSKAAASSRSCNPTAPPPIPGTAPSP